MQDGKKTKRQQIGALEAQRQQNAEPKAAEPECDPSAELETLYRTMPVGLAFMSPDLRYLRVNEYLAALNGYPVAAHLGAHLRDILPQSVEEVEAAQRRVITTGQPVLNLGFRSTTATVPDDVRDWEVSYFPVHSPAGALLGINTVLQDVTERKRAEAALRNAHDRAISSDVRKVKLTSLERQIIANQHKILEALYPDEASYHAQARVALETGTERHDDDPAQFPGYDAPQMIDYSPDFIFLTRLDNFKFVQVNKTACDQYGYSQDELLALGIFDLEVDPCAEEDIRRLYATTPVGDVVEVYGINRKKNGQTFPVHVRFRKLDEEFGLAAVRDISGQEAAEEELKQSKEVVDAVVEGFRQSDEALLEAETAAETVLGSTPPSGELTEQTKDVRLLERPLQRVAGEEEAGLIPSVDARETRPPADERLGHLTQLTQREWTILQLLLENQRVGSIAQALSIGPSTVRTHLTSIFHKLGVHSQTELLKQIGSGAVKRITVKTPAGS